MVPLGAAIVAGLAAQVWKDTSQLPKAKTTEYEPTISADERDKKYSHWKDAVSRCMHWQCGKDLQHKEKRDSKVTPFDPESLFNIRALSTLQEKVGIPVMSILNEYTQLLQSKLEIPPHPSHSLNTLLDTWQGGGVSIRPTWKNLLKIIRQLHLDDLARQMETYLSGATAEEHPEEVKGKDIVLAEEGGVEILRLQEEATILKLKEQVEELMSENKQQRGYLSIKEAEEKPLDPVPVKAEPKVEVVMQTKAESTLVQSTAWNLHGLEVCGEMTAVVYSSHAQQITWEGFGLKIYVEEGSLPPDVKQCIVFIKASLAGQYEFPENSHLVSAVFWLRCEPMCKFTKPVTVEIQHCARSENVANLNLKFVRAVCNQKQLPYNFKHLGGNFTSHSSYGVIELGSFSGMAITQEGTNERRYLAYLLSKEVKGRQTAVVIEIFFVIICNTDAHRTVMSRHSHFKDAQLESDQPVVFDESKQVEFQISKRSQEWKITTINSAVIQREDVDSFSLKENTWIPYSHLRAKFHRPTCTSPIPDLECEVDIIGAKEPHNKFAIDIVPEGPASSSQGLARSSGSQTVTKLTIINLAVLLEQVSNHAAKWRDIGRGLGFKQAELDDIKASPLLLSDAPKSWLEGMLSKWLEWAPGDRRGSTDFATLEGLRDALRQADLGATAHDLHL